MDLSARGAANDNVTVVAVKTVLLLCDGLSAINDIRNGVLCSLVPDLMCLMSAVTGPFAQRDATTQVTVRTVHVTLTVCCE